jgi:hypothetical protein
LQENNESPKNKRTIHVIVMGLFHGRVAQSNDLLTCTATTVNLTKFQGGHEDAGEIP